MCIPTISSSWLFYFLGGFRSKDMGTWLAESS